MNDKITSTDEYVLKQLEKMKQENKQLKTENTKLKKEVDKLNTMELPKQPFYSFYILKNYDYKKALKQSRLTLNWLKTQYKNKDIKKLMRLKYESGSSWNSFNKPYKIITNTYQKAFNYGDTKILFSVFYHNSDDITCYSYILDNQKRFLNRELCEKTAIKKVWIEVASAIKKIEKEEITNE